jgi:hypothetical protein
VSEITYPTAPWSLTSTLSSRDADSNVSATILEHPLHCLGGLQQPSSMRCIWRTLGRRPPRSDSFNLKTAPIRSATTYRPPIPSSRNGRTSGRRGGGPDSGARPTQPMPPMRQAKIGPHAHASPGGRKDETPRRLYISSGFSIGEAHRLVEFRAYK